MENEEQTCGNQAAKRKFCIRHSSFLIWPLGHGLAFFTANTLADDTDTFALVRLRRIIGTDIGGDGSDELLVSTLDLDLGLIGDGDLDTLGDIEENRVRIAKREVELFALEVGLEADALDFEILDVAFSGALHHAGNDRTGGAIHGSGETGLLDRGDGDLF